MSDHRPPPDGAALIVAEIAERIAELEELRHGFGADVVQRLHTLYLSSPLGFRIAVDVMRGRLDAVADSFTVQADARGLTKQCLFVQWNTMLTDVAGAFPELADALRETRENCLQPHRNPTPTNYAGELSDCAEHHL